MTPNARRSSPERRFSHGLIYSIDNEQRPMSLTLSWRRRNGQLCNRYYYESETRRTKLSIEVINRNENEGKRPVRAPEMFSCWNNSNSNANSFLSIVKLILGVERNSIKVFPIGGDTHRYHHHQHHKSVSIFAFSIPNSI